MKDYKSLIQEPSIRGRIALLIEEFSRNANDFAKKVGIHPSMIYKWLNKTDEPSAKYRSQICQKIGLSREWLDTGQGQMRPQNAGNTATTTYNSNDEVISVKDYYVLVGQLKEARRQLDTMTDRIGQQLSRLETTAGDRGTSKTDRERNRHSVAHAV